VTIKVDAYPDYDFNGTVTSFSPATGSRFNPDNATGNFVKQFNVYRKITIDANNDIEKIKLLRPGMNVDIDVHIK
jgi:membrane fusion protein (multidrug efflux system)